MTAFIRAAGVVLLVVIGACTTDTATPSAQAQTQQQPPERPEVFLPLDQLPPQDQLAAAPLLIAAYSFVALALFAYVISLARRMTVVQREITRLESDFKKSGRL